LGNIFHLLSYYIDSITLSENQLTFYKKLAYKLASKMNLSKDIVLKEPIRNYPLWLCEVQGLPAKNCFDFKPFYHTMGVTRTAGANFNDLLPSPLNQRYGLENTTNLKLQRVGVKLYIMNRYRI